jgi:hypothetical protein
MSDDAADTKETKPEGASEPITIRVRDQVRRFISRRRTVPTSLSNAPPFGVSFHVFFRVILIPSYLAYANTFGSFFAAEKSRRVANTKYHHGAGST